MLTACRRGVQVVLFIDEIHLVLGAGRTDGAMDAANLLKPMLARGELKCIGATTVQEYRYKSGHEGYLAPLLESRSEDDNLLAPHRRQHIEKDPAFERRFQQVQVGEPSVPDTINILRGLKERYENFHGVRILDRALVVASELSSRYIQGRFLPDKAIDLVDEACSSLRVELDSVRMCRSACVSGGMWIRCTIKPLAHLPSLDAHGPALHTSRRCPRSWISCSAKSCGCRWRRRP